MLQRIRQRWPALLAPEIVAAALLLALGAALRLYALGEIPPPLHTDEVRAGYESWALLNFGVDQNRFSWPVHFVSSGSGQSVLYSYLAIPFIALGGLTAVVFRLPMALTGILALFLMWKVGEKAAGRPFALLLLLLLALNSWHLMATRWGLDANLLPFVILLSVYFLSRPDRDRFSIQAAAVFTLALSVYAYSLAYAFAPLFLGLVFIWLTLNRLADWRRLLALSALALVTTLPIILLVVINFFDLDPVSILGVSIPRYTGPSRYEEMSLLFRGPWEGIAGNFPDLAAVLLGGDDDSLWGIMPGFGALPPFTILLSFLGFCVVLYHAKTRQEYGVHLLVAFWFAAALLIALITNVHIHRINALWLPAIYLMAVGAFFICRPRPVIYAAAVAYVAFSGFFIYQYFRNYNDTIDIDYPYFRSSMGPAIERAVAAAGPEAIYVTDHNTHPSSHVLYYTRPTPWEYWQTGIISRPNDAFSCPLALGQFVFISPLTQREDERVPRQLLEAGGIDLGEVAHYVLSVEELAEIDPSRFVLEKYGQYYYAYDPAVGAGGAARGPLLRVERPAVAAPPAAADQFTVYLENNAITYYKEGCTAYDTREWFFLHIVPVDVADLAEERRAFGFDNRDFWFNRQGALYGPNCWATIPLPDYPIAAIRTGQFVDGEGELWRVEFPVEQKAITRAPGTR